MANKNAMYINEVTILSGLAEQRNQREDKNL